MQNMTRKTLLWTRPASKFQQLRQARLVNRILFFVIDDGGGGVGVMDNSTALHLWMMEGPERKRVTSQN